MPTCASGVELPVKKLATPSAAPKKLDSVCVQTPRAGRIPLAAIARLPERLEGAIGGGEPEESAGVVPEDEPSPVD